MTDRLVASGELDIGAVEAEFDRIVRSACPGQALLAGRLFDRIRPDRWALEWSLPLWLGEAVGLAPEPISRIVLSNVVGLGAIRIEDDLVDGEVPREQVAGSRVLGAALYDAAVQPYRAMFDGGSPFWAELDRRMDEWRVATGHPAATGPGRGHPEPVTERLAARGAPLRISAYAVCLAADRADVYPLLGRCLDHALEALVLYDHAADWEADLEAGRWNAFVAALTNDPGVPAEREGARTAVRVALLTSDAAEAFFARIGDQLSEAIASAEQLPVRVPRLLDYLASLAGEVEAHGASYRGRYREFGDHAARLFLQGTTDGR